LLTASTTNATVAPSLSVSAVRGTTMGVVLSSKVRATDAVMPMDEAMRLFAEHGAEILGPPLSLSNLS